MDIGPSGGGLLLGSGGICPGCCGVVGALHWSWLLLGLCIGFGCCVGLALVLAAVWALLLGVPGIGLGAA